VPIDTTLRGSLTRVKTRRGNPAVVFGPFAPAVDQGPKVFEEAGAIVAQLFGNELARRLRLARTP
jgi:hypothetical protein